MVTGKAEPAVVFMVATALVLAINYPAPRTNAPASRRMPAPR
jgi:Mg2+/citrate symporter